MKNYGKFQNKQTFSAKTDKSDVNSVFSVGQKQLICQAKMILDEKKIIVLDEATANVDMKTADFIQETLKYKFSDCTIITISHRLNTISDYDKIMVISEGQIVEFDTPFNLLANSINSISVDTLDIQTEFFKIFDIKIQKENCQAIFDTHSFLFPNFLEFFFPLKVFLSLGRSLNFYSSLI
ncbi:unnamed protein product [Paramecium primaurelia]|uniref:ABC transporter domain-containing protein n=1 Tax=Paramecium primaurelia TaxID=5886 RepID=A0A8S1MLQ2_PARPR|nr:unnamed protein product [Paramecium primaurelia]